MFEEPRLSSQREGIDSLAEAAADLTGPPSIRLLTHDFTAVQLLRESGPGLDGFWDSFP